MCLGFGFRRFVVSRRLFLGLPFGLLVMPFLVFVDYVLRIWMSIIAEIVSTALPSIHKQKPKNNSQFAMFKNPLNNTLSK